MIAGTPSFVAPEQAAAEAPDARADQYSLAALAFLLLTGRPPFTPHLARRRRCTRARCHRSRRRSGRSRRRSRQVLRRGLARDREDRYPDVTAFVDALAAALGPVADGPDRRSRGSTATPSSPSPGRGPSPQPASGELPEPTPPRRRRRRLAVAGAGRAARAGGRRRSRVRRAARLAADRADRRRRHRHPLGHRRRRLGPRRRHRRLAPPNADVRLPGALRRHQPDWADPDDAARASSSALLPRHRAARPGAAAPRVRHRRARRSQDTPDGDELDDRHVYADCPGGGRRRAVVQVTANTAAVGAGPQRRPGDRQPGPRRRGDPRDLSSASRRCWPACHRRRRSAPAGPSARPVDRASGDRGDGGGVLLSAEGHPALHRHPQVAVGRRRWHRRCRRSGSSTAKSSRSPLATASSQRRDPARPWRRRPTRCAPLDDARRAVA